jgi:hypothetical protein
LQKKTSTKQQRTNQKLGNWHGGFEACQTLAPNATCMLGGLKMAAGMGNFRVGPSSASNEQKLWFQQC